MQLAADGPEGPAVQLEGGDEYYSEAALECRDPDYLPPEEQVCVAPEGGEGATEARDPLSDALATGLTAEEMTDLIAWLQELAPKLDYYFVLERGSLSEVCEQTIDALQADYGDLSRIVSQGGAPLPIGTDERQWVAERKARILANIEELETAGYNASNANDHVSTLISERDQLREEGLSDLLIAGKLAGEHDAIRPELRALGLPDGHDVWVLLALDVDDGGYGFSPEKLQERGFIGIRAFRNKEDGRLYVEWFGGLYRLAGDSLEAMDGWCRDEDFVLGSAHAGEICFREYRGDFGSGRGQVCFYPKGGGYDSYDDTGFADAIDEDGRCDYSAAEALLHGATDAAPYYGPKVLEAIGEAEVKRAQSPFRKGPLY